MNLTGRRHAHQGGVEETQEAVSLRHLSGDHSNDNVDCKSLALFGTGKRPRVFKEFQ